MVNVLIEAIVATALMVAFCTPPANGFTNAQVAVLFLANIAIVGVAELLGAWVKAVEDPGNRLFLKLLITFACVGLIVAWWIGR